MPQKVTFIFSQSTIDQKTGGWSETWYYDGSASEINAATGVFMSRRAAMLPVQAVCQGFRLQEVGAKGQFIAASVVGTATFQQDIPQMAINCRCQAGGKQNVKFFQLRGIPDNQVNGGRYAPIDTYPQAVNQFFTSLVNQGWRFRAVDLTKPKVGLLSVNALGVFQVKAGLVFDVGSTITLLRAKGVDGSKLSGDYYVSAKADNQNGTFLHWPGTVIQQRGEARVKEFFYPQIQTGSIKVYNVTTRKVGRPFFLYRGRQTKR